MRQVASNLNKDKTWVNIEKARALYRKCNGREYRAIYKLYDKGYINRANELRGKSLNKVILQNFKEHYKFLLSDLDGSLMVTKERFLYAILVMENKIKELKGTVNDIRLESMEDFRDFCSVMYDYLEAKEDCTALRKLIHLPTLAKDGSKVLVNPKVYISYSTVKSSIPFDSKAVRECIERPIQTELVCFPLVKVVIKNLAMKYGVSNERLEAWDRGETGIFFTDMSKEMEYKLFNLVVTGDLQIDSLLGESLFNGVLKRYKEALEDTSNKLGICSFKDATYFDSFTDECTAIREETKRVLDLGGQVVGLSQDYVYYVIPSDNKENWYTDRVLFTQEDMGYSCVDWVTEDSISDFFNILYGTCGEFIFEKDLPYLPVRYTPVGEPIKIHTFTKSRGKRVLSYAKAYSILDLVDENGNMPNPRVGNNIDFMFEAVEDSEARYKASNNIPDDTLYVSKSAMRGILGSDKIKTPSELMDVATSVSMYMLLSDCGYTDTEILSDYDVDVTGLNDLSEEELNLVLQCSSLAYDNYGEAYR